MSKHPCQGCIYYKVCGNSNRIMPCDGRVTKSQKKEEMKKDGTYSIRVR